VLYTEVKKREERSTLQCRKGIDEAVRGREAELFASSGLQGEEDRVSGR
jgi:hypothetical protein